MPRVIGHAAASSPNPGFSRRASSPIGISSSHLRRTNNPSRRNAMSSDGASDDEQALMAQAMGFSSFGSQSRPQKKRRYNPRADAALGDGPLPESSSGANSTALGAPRASVNAAEIDLDDDNDNGDDVDKLLSSIAAPSSADQAQVRPVGLPERPAIAATATSSHPQQQQHIHNAHDTPRAAWYEGYYDPNSNENPWERLEKARGLESRGSWIPHDAHPVGGQQV
ncbi:hypothetical protein G7046_g8044 [Stylonectria norvegica]|nr:hypothetical protein G7046_g8044 [Stylonectria norvegica]